MESENRTHSTNSVQACQNCRKEFTIEPEDFLYYEKIKVPPPTWCPECRLVRREASKNVWTVYWRDCDNCGKRTLTMYHKDNSVRVFCSGCWWSDNWDGTEYGMDYDPKRPFFEQLYELSRKTPWAAAEVLGPTMINSEYCNGATWLRNCYLTFWADYCENVAHSSILFKLKDSSDCLRARESELCYESIGINKCYATYFSEECDACTNVWFSRNCYNCTNCIGCVNLRGATNYIFNVKYSKEEYDKKVKEFGLESFNNLQALKEKAENFWLTKPYREYTGNSLNLNVTGEYVFESKNSRDLYLCTSVENSRYCQFVTVPTAKDCYDYSGWGANVDLIYETHSTGEKASNIKFSFSGYPDTYNTEYCMYSSSAKNCFGCVNLKRKSYCILNKQYSKEEYEKLKAIIIEDMKVNPYIDPQNRVWAYGEFFPHQMSLFAYNETDAMKFFPKTKEEALSEGFTWYDEEPTEHKSTLPVDALPENISTTLETITEHVLGCVECKRGYKIGILEYNLLKKMNMPVPHICPQCRSNSRFARLNPPRLWKRNCAKCEQEINTAFSPDRPEIVYCVSCYQQEFA
ncbi:MAG: hypothetical protein M3M85_02095 [bacterium]|nr:hypothetical protein [bacterium]